MKIKELIQLRSKSAARIQEICDLVEAREDKKFTDAEKQEVEALRREIALTDARIAAASAPAPATTEERSVHAEMDAFLVYARSAPEKASGHLERSYEGMKSTDVEAVMPLTINDIVQPLEKGLIYKELGLPLHTGLSGSYCWPVVSSVEAQFAGESVSLADTKIEVNKLTPRPERMGIVIPITNQTITQSRGTALEIIRTQMPLTIERTLNRAMFCPEKYSTSFYGPIAEAGTKGVFAGTDPTYKELIAMRGQVFAKGIGDDGTCAYVMGAAMKARLEATPVDPGSGRMIVENGKIGGIPVFTTEYINMKKDGTATEKENVLFGVFSYLPLGQFGEFRYIVDPYADSRADVVNFVLNSDWSLTVLRNEAFAHYKTK